MTDLGRLICTLVVASALIQSVGCSSGEARRPTQPASGTLKILGKAAPGATLVFHPDQPWGKDEPKPRATVKPDGSFEVTTYEGNDGAPEGNYTVTVEWFVPNKPDDGNVTNRAPAKYGKAQSSPLKATIGKGPNTLPALEIK